jgi:predicted permease
MSAFVHFATLTAPLFLLVLLGYALPRLAHWPTSVSDALTRFVFTVAIPAYLFRLMSDFSRLPPVDPRVLLVFFGGCAIVFVLGRLVGRYVFRLDGVGQSIFAIGGIFANNVLLGVPMAAVTLGPSSMPAISLVLVFNSLVLWTLVTVSVEWARHRDLSLAGLARTTQNVLTNPVIAAILLGTLFGASGWTLPAVLDQTLGFMAQAALPLSLIALGMGLAEYGLRAGWKLSVAISALKLVAQPLAVALLARLVGLGPDDTAAVVLLAALPVGANVYLMSRQFATLEGPVASSLVLTTAAAALTTPIALALVGARVL